LRENALMGDPLGIKRARYGKHPSRQSCFHGFLLNLLGFKGSVIFSSYHARLVLSKTVPVNGWLV
jgi:hypothetical protein